LFCLQAAQITAAIVTFMMRPDQLRGVREKRDLLDQVISRLHVLVHEHALRSGAGNSVWDRAGFRDERVF